MANILKGDAEMGRARERERERETGASKYYSYIT
jgi:hypothetical protein